ncbi:NUDIX domain-containing protein [Negadavirga shengliensis]|uniref:GDP-mannose pyrophosphatase n=1 Tax=Negadavirga shengliensis TaxID=1389218 RepID=A0ABV9SYP1_9BACT
MENPWKKLSEKIVYDNPWIRVAEHQVITPNNTEGIYGVVSFKNKAIGIVPLDKAMNTWLVGQYRYTLEEYTWEIPMGGGPILEDVLESAKRELKEETGMSAARWTNIMRIHTSNSVTDEEGFVFLAEQLTEGEPQFDDTEDLKIRKVPFQKAIEMVLSGEITDAISIAALLKTQLVIQQRG